MQVQYGITHNNGHKYTIVEEHTLSYVVEYFPTFQLYTYKHLCQTSLGRGKENKGIYSFLNTL